MTVYSKTVYDKHITAITFACDHDLDLEIGCTETEIDLFVGYYCLLGAKGENDDPNILHFPEVFQALP